MIRTAEVDHLFEIRDLIEEARDSSVEPLEFSSRLVDLIEGLPQDDYPTATRALALITDFRRWLSRSALSRELDGVAMFARQLLKQRVERMRLEEARWSRINLDRSFGEAVLGELERAHPRSLKPSEIADRLKASRAQVSRALARLNSQGAVRLASQAPGADGRSRSYGLNPSTSGSRAVTGVDLVHVLRDQIKVNGDLEDVTSAVAGLVFILAEPSAVEDVRELHDYEDLAVLAGELRHD